MIYQGDFGCADDVFSNFKVSTADQEGVRILYAGYENENYEGSAGVVFLKDGRFYEVTGSHCSCYGLEDQWDPNEVTVASMRHLQAKGATPYGMNYSAVLTVLDDLVQDAEKLPDDHLAVLIRLALG